jgi:hypothetical protein
LIVCKKINIRKKLDKIYPTEIKLNVRKLINDWMFGVEEFNVSECNENQ